MGEDVRERCLREVKASQHNGRLLPAIAAPPEKKKVAHFPAVDIRTFQASRLDKTKAPSSTEPAAGAGEKPAGSALKKLSERRKTGHFSGLGAKLGIQRKKNNLVNLFKAQDEFDLEQLASKPRKPLGDYSKKIQQVYAANPASHNVEAAHAVVARMKQVAGEAKVPLDNLEDAPHSSQKMKEFWEAREDIRWSRPFFVYPIPKKVAPAKVHVEKEVEQMVEKPKWNIDVSVFHPRKEESDARDYYETEGVRKRSLNLDWKRTVGKTRFIKAITRADTGVQWGEDSVEKELVEIKTAISRAYPVLYNAYYYFCVTGTDIGESAFSMSFNQWTEFLKDSEIPHPKSKNCNMANCDNIFVVSNFEEEKSNLTRKEAAAQKLLADENDDRALMRFEFVEAVVRLAIAKHGMKTDTDDVSEAVDMLLEREIIPNLCPEATEDADVFRHERLYNEENDLVLHEHQTFLRACYNLFKQLGLKQKHSHLGMEGFLNMLEASSLLGPATGFSKREAKLVMIWSKMSVVDEIRHRNRAVSLTFVDFLEAVGRVADWISMPNPEDLEKFYDPELNPAGSPSLLYEFYTKAPTSEQERLRRASAEFGNTRTRPLHIKLSQVIEVMYYSLKAQFGGADEASVAGKLNSMARMLG
ncbi:hypothetical protein CYMTET_38797 [Cymbomonas tetramitiformis]|uniref:Uncharacterized protein n=1 Tax=Cymbomonas tetramitiformis TaxID=36881 RepID=A0AAE0F688_9CHLO|nr:hypothetical protein CYMTET_38797 [Cymbomonas tetramitiformis]